MLIKFTWIFYATIGFVSLVCQTLDCFINIFYKVHTTALSMGIEQTEI